MFVGSYLELHTTLIGWMLYDLIWEILLQTGAVFVPILWIVIRNWRDASIKSVRLPPAELSAKKNLWDLVFAFLILFFACVPAWPIAPTTIQYQPNPQFSDQSPAPITQPSDPSTYGESIGTVTYAAGDPLVPIWWYFLMRFSAGVNHAVAQNLPTPGDLMVASQQMAAANIKDPKLAHDLQAFITDCFTNARAKYSNMQARGQVASSYPPSEADWVGSRIFMETPGLYLACGNANECGGNLLTRRVEGFDVNPTCADWWGSLKTRLIEQTDTDLWTGLRATVAAIGALDASEYETVQLKSILYNYGSKAVTSKIGDDYRYAYVSQQDPIGQSATLLSGIAKDTVGVIGSGYAAATFAAKMHVVKMALPMIKAVLLMVIYIVLPIVLLVSAYEIETVFTMSVVIFSITMLSALWSFAGFAEYHLTNAMFPENKIINLLRGLTSSDVAIKGLILGMMMAGLYILMPIAWFYALVWAGQRSGSTALKMSDNASNQANDAGNKGPSATGKLAGGVRGK